MRSSDRTLLAGLGFGDADKKDRRHDLACQYLAQEDVAERIYASLCDNKTIVNVTFESAESEVHLAKGEGKYKTTIGFLDLLLYFHGTRTIGKERSVFPNVLVEVKIHPVPVGDILRQMGLYEEYRGNPDGEAPYWFHRVVATAFDLSAEDVEMLDSKLVKHLRLGPGFDEYCRQREEKPTPSNSPVF